MNIFNVLTNLSKLKGKKFDTDEVIVAFEDYEENGETYVIVKESENTGYDMIAYIDTVDSTQFLFQIDDDNIIIGIYMDP